MQKEDLKRSQKASREQTLKQKADMELPVNKFLNAQDKDGGIKFPIAKKLRKYFLENPDPILDDMRMVNAMLHQLRWNKQQAIKYLAGYENGEPVKDKAGEIMSKDNCTCTAHQWSDDDNTFFPGETCESCYNKQQVEEHELFMYELHKEADINRLSVDIQDIDDLPF